MAAPTKDRNALAQTFDGALMALDQLGEASEHMIALYALAEETVAALQTEQRRRGKPVSPITELEAALLAQWDQMTQQFMGQYLGITMQLAAQIARVPKGPQIVDIRHHKR